MRSTNIWRFTLILQDGQGGNGGVTKPAPMMKFVVHLFLLHSGVLTFLQNQNIRNFHGENYFITLYGINGNAKWSGWTECQGAELSGAGLQCFQPGCAYHIQVDHWQLYVQVYWLEMVFFLTVIKHPVINLTPIVAVRLPATIRTGSIVAQPTWWSRIGNSQRCLPHCCKTNCYTVRLWTRTTVLLSIKALTLPSNETPVPAVMESQWYVLCVVQWIWNPPYRY